MKKYVTTFLSLLLMVSSITGCGAKTNEAAAELPEGDTDSEAVSEETTEPVTITIWHDTSDEIGALLQTELDKLSPDIKAEVVKKEKMTEALKLVGDDPDSAPDMYFFAHDKIGTFAEMGILSPVTDFLSEEDLQDMIPMTIEAGTYKDALYQAPIFFEATMLLYNKALMKEVPATTEELYKYAKENTKDGIYGLLEQHSTAYFAAAWMHGFGGYIINDKAEPGLSLPETIAAVTYHKKFSDLMPVDGDYATLTTLFTEGKAHAMIAGPWLIPEAEEAGIDVGVAPMPTVDETGKPLMSYSGVQGLSVLKNGSEDKKEAIAKVLKQAMSMETGLAFVDSLDSAPANAKCYEDSSVSDNEVVMNLKEAAENAVPMPNVPEMDVMWTVTENMLVAVNKNGADVQTACEKAQKEAIDQIASMQ